MSDRETDTAHHYASLFRDKMHEVPDYTRTCTAWRTFGVETVEKTLARNSEAFMLCEYPERAITPSSVMDPEHCEACRVVLCGIAHNDPGQMMNASDELAAELGLGHRRGVPVIEMVRHYAEKTGDPALVSAVVRLAFPAAVS